jgi:hypothetical protein
LLVLFLPRYRLCPIFEPGRDKFLRSKLGGSVRGRERYEVAATRRIRFEADDDGGEASTYDGIFVLADVWYRFRCQVFVDGSGLRFLSDIQKFEAVEWRVHLPMSKAG